MAKHVWSGQLPPKTEKPTSYSSKVFLGGLPWDIAEATLVQTFKQFGQVKIEWPPLKKGIPQKGFAYMLMESERHVRIEGLFFMRFFNRIFLFR